MFYPVRHFTGFLFSLLLLLLAGCDASSSPPLTEPAVTAVDFVTLVQPADGSVIPTAEFDGRVCATVDGLPLAQPGDELTLETMRRRVELAVNGRAAPIVEASAVASLTVLELDGGPATVSGPFTFCWAVDLPPGPHQAGLTYRPPSGAAASFSWQFATADTAIP